MSNKDNVNYNRNTGKGMKLLNSILLVDDDLIIVRLNKMLIENEGLAEQVLHASNGAEALRCIQGQAIFKDPGATNLILLDINMPVMGGFEFLDEYLKLGLQHQGSNTIIILSSSGRQEELNKARSYGIVQDYWLKPIKRQQWMDFATRLRTGR